MSFTFLNKTYHQCTEF